MIGGTVAFVALVLICALTPIAWNAAGRLSESYPELFYIAFGWPAALALMLVVAIHWHKPTHTNLLAETLVWTGTAVIVWLCALLVLITLALIFHFEPASLGLIGRTVQLSMTYFYGLLLAALTGVIGGVSIRRVAKKFAD
jgi:hypothetical protein